LKLLEAESLTSESITPRDGLLGGCYLPNGSSIDPTWTIRGQASWIIVYETSNLVLQATKTITGYVSGLERLKEVSAASPEQLSPIEEEDIEKSIVELKEGKIRRFRNVSDAIRWLKGL
jgi:hypothetical protein